MSGFNLCEAFFSGYYVFKEEFASCALGYMLSPYSTGGTAALKPFLDALRRSGQYTGLIDDALQSLDSPGLTWEAGLVNDPLSSPKDIASALEFKEIDVLIRIKDVVLLIENKIYAGSVGNIARQINDYRLKLGARWQDRIIPIAVLPRTDGRKFENIITLGWNGDEDFTLGKYFTAMTAHYPALKDFADLVSNDFQLSGRAAEISRKSYDDLIAAFDENFPEIIGELFPPENFAPGDDMNIGGCLLYRLPLKKSQTECFPFRLMVNGKCEIQFHGLRKAVFLKGKTFDGKHTIRDIVKAFLMRAGVKFTDRYHFSFREFARAEVRAAFRQVLELLQQIDQQEWNEDDFFKYYTELTAAMVSPAELKMLLQKCLDIPDDALLHDKSKFNQLARALKAAINQ